MTEPTYRQRMLRHCLWMAKSDPEYAQWAAAWYEKHQPQELEGLARKVEQTVAEWREKVAARQSASPSPAPQSERAAPELAVQASTQGSTARRRP